MRFTFVLIFILFFSGCTSFNDSVTANPSIKLDEFSGAKNIYQPEVSAASKISESWHMLSLRWSETTPNTVYLGVAADTVRNITGLAFNIDGELLEARRAEGGTDYGDYNPYGTKSRRQFAVSFEEFEKIAAAKLVKMRVDEFETYTLSSFGVDTGALINKKFPKFLEMVAVEKQSD